MSHHRPFLLLPALVLSLAAQKVAQPSRILEVGPYVLDSGFRVFLTDGGRVLAFSQSRDEDSIVERVAIWDGVSGEFLRRDLEPLDPETTFGFGCGGDGSHGFNAWSNVVTPFWNASTQRFQWTEGNEDRLHTMDEAGNSGTAPWNPPPVSRLRDVDLNLLEVIVPGEPSWWLSRGKGLPEGYKPTRIQRILAGRSGFQEALADRAGRWVACIWEGITENPTANPPQMPFKRDGNPRWIIWHQTSTLPVLDISLASIAGPIQRITRMALNEAGDRVILQTDREVVLFDPVALKVVSHRPGDRVVEVPSRNHLLIGKASGSTYERIDMATGDLISRVIIPRTTDPIESDPESTEAGSPKIARTRFIGDPIAFSPNGRYMVAPRYGLQGAHWDGLVLWDLEQAMLPTESAPLRPPAD